MKALLDFFASLFSGKKKKSATSHTTELHTAEMIPAKPLRSPARKPVASRSVTQEGGLEQTLAYRCLSLTGTFETSRSAPRCFAGVTGNFDGQGISFGVLQWNFGQGTLQKLLTQMNSIDSKVLKKIFGRHYPALVKTMSMKPAAAVKWAVARQDARKRLKEPWKGMFRKLGLTKASREVQVKRARRRFDKAIEWCRRYKLKSERAAALMFDIKVQNNSISSTVRAQILKDFREYIKRSGTLENEQERKKMEIIANRRAEASNPKYVEDVRKRKLCCAKGFGTVHGKKYNLKSEFGITMKSFVV